MEIFITFTLGFVSAFIGSIAGGSGLIGVPGLLMLGLPPHIALGTFNFADVGSSVGNIIKFTQYKNLGVRWKDILILTAIAVPSAMIGARIVVSIDPEILSKLIGIILLVLIPLLFKNKSLGTKTTPAKGARLIWSHIAFFLARAWGGFFSPGSGLIETYVRIRGYGYTILQGKAVTRVANITSGIGIVIIFASSKMIAYKLGLVMFLGMFLGGYIGTSYAIKKGDAWLKPLLGIAIVITSIKMIFF